MTLKASNSQFGENSHVKENFLPSQKLVDFLCVMFVFPSSLVFPRLLLGPQTGKGIQTSVICGKRLKGSFDIQFSRSYSHRKGVIQVSCNFCQKGHLYAVQFVIEEKISAIEKSRKKSQNKAKTCKWREGHKTIASSSERAVTFFNSTNTTFQLFHINFCINRINASLTRTGSNQRKKI